MSINLAMFGGATWDNYGSQYAETSGLGLANQLNKGVDSASRIDKAYNPGFVFIQKQYQTQTYYLETVDRRDKQVEGFIRPTSERDRYFEGIYNERSIIAAAEQAAQARIWPCN